MGCLGLAHVVEGAPRECVQRQWSCLGIAQKDRMARPARNEHNVVLLARRSVRAFGALAARTFSWFAYDLRSRYDRLVSGTDRSPVSLDEKKNVLAYNKAYNLYTRDSTDECGREGHHLTPERGGVSHARVRCSHFNRTIGHATRCGRASCRQKRRALLLYCHSCSDIDISLEMANSKTINPTHNLEQTRETSCPLAGITL